MSPKLRDIDVDAIAARLDAAGDATAATALRTLRDAVTAQDGALRDLVADAAELREDFDEDGSTVVLRTGPNSFDDLATAFGYPPVAGFDAEGFARAAAVHGEATPADGQAYLSGLDHLRARMAAEHDTPEELLARGHVAVRIGHGPREETLYHWDERNSPALAESRAAETHGSPTP